MNHIWINELNDDSYWRLVCVWIRWAPMWLLLIRAHFWDARFQVNRIVLTGLAVESVATGMAMTHNYNDLALVKFASNETISSVGWYWPQLPAWLVMG